MQQHHLSDGKQRFIRQPPKKQIRVITAISILIIILLISGCRKNRDRDSNFSHDLPQTREIDKGKTKKIED